MKNSSSVVTKASEKPKDIAISRDGKYQSVPLMSIEVIDRPQTESESKEVLFYNPRFLENFDTETMRTLRESICRQGLLTPLIVRAFTEGATRDGRVIKVQLIAGERRFRSLRYIYDKDLPVVDEETKEKVSGRAYYEKVACRVYFNIGDEEALQIAFKENDQRSPLKIEEEIALVERLTERGMKQDEIADLLDTNVTFVSQTGSFRRELPKKAFGLLLKGLLSRHVAVQLLSFKAGKDRKAAFEAAVLNEQRDYQETIDALQEGIIDAEDYVEIANDEEEKAKAKGDTAAARKAARKRESAQNTLNRLHERKQRRESRRGQIQQGHLGAGAISAGIAPKKPKILNRKLIESMYVELIEEYTKRSEENAGDVDSVTGEPYPLDVLQVVKATAQAILHGEGDPLKVVRKIMVDRGDWSVPESDADAEE
jgi:hypothetical protein